MRGPKIAIAHSYSLNVGDMAVLSTTVGILTGIAPDSQITALVSHPDFTSKKLPRLNARLERWPWPVDHEAGKGPLRFFGYAAVYLSHIVSVLAYRIAGTRVFLFNKKYSAPLNAIFDCDILLSPGGDFINPRYGFITTLSEFIMAKALGKKLVICAQTIGPFEGLLNGRASAFVLNMADLILIREQKTAKLLADAGVKGVEVTGDIVFAFPKALEEGKKRPGKAVICVEDLHPPALKERYAKKMKELSRRVNREFGYRIVYMPANCADAAFHADLAQGIEDAEVIHEVHAPEKIADILSDAEFLISSRMHPIVLGALSCTPFFAIGESFKFEAVLGPICEGCCMKGYELETDEGVERIMDAIRRREALRRKIFGTLPGAKERAKRNAVLLCKKLEEWGYPVMPA